MESPDMETMVALVALLRPTDFSTAQAVRRERYYYQHYWPSAHPDAARFAEAVAAVRGLAASAGAWAERVTAAAISLGLAPATRLFDHSIGGASTLDCRSVWFARTPTGLGLDLLPLDETADARYPFAPPLASQAADAYYYPPAPGRTRPDRGWGAPTPVWRRVRAVLEPAVYAGA